MYAFQHYSLMCHDAERHFCNNGSLLLSPVDHIRNYSGTILSFSQKYATQVDKNKPKNKIHRK